MPEPARDAAGAGPGRFPALAPPLAAVVVNHLLAGASWACERLKPFADKTVRFEIAPFTIAFVIRRDGQVEDANPESVPDASFTLTPGIAMRVLADDRNAWREVQLGGNAALAREVLAIAQNLRWDVEEDLSRVFGDIAAHRMVQAAQELRRWQRATADNFARSAVAYWTEEQPLIARRADVERFNREVDALRDDVARFDKRIGRLANHQAENKSPGNRR